MAGKKRRKRKAVKRRNVLTGDERRELDIICDRLYVQDPDGESLDRCLQTLKTTLVGRDALVAALLDRLSRKPAAVTLRVYREFKDLVTAKGLQRTLRQVEYRLRQRGLVGDRDAGQERERANVVLVPREQVSTEAFLVMAGSVWSVAALVPSRYDDGLVMPCLDIDFSWKIVGTRSTVATRRQFREFFARLKDRDPLPIPVWHAAGLAMEALARYPEQQRARESDPVLTGLRSWLEPERVPYSREVLTRKGKRFTGPAQDAEREVIESLLPVIDQVVPAKVDLWPYYERLRSIQNSVLVVSEAIREEQVHSLLVEAAAAGYDERAVHYHRRLLEELAFWHQGTGHEDEAAKFWAVAGRLDQVRSGAELDYFANLVLAGFFFYWPEDMEGGEASAESRVPISDSGIILP